MSPPLGSSDRQNLVQSNRAAKSKNIRFRFSNVSVSYLGKPTDRADWPRGVDQHPLHDQDSSRQRDLLFVDLFNLRNHVWTARLFTHHW